MKYFVAFIACIGTLLVYATIAALLGLEGFALGRIEQAGLWLIVMPAVWTAVMKFWPSKKGTSQQNQPARPHQLNIPRAQTPPVDAANPPVERTPTPAPVAETLSTPKTQPPPKPRTANQPTPSISSTVTGVESSNTCMACNSPNPPGVNFCEQCGASLKRICFECGQENDARKPFCGKCGNHGETSLRLQTAITRMNELMRQYDYDALSAELELASQLKFIPRGQKGKDLLAEFETLRASALQRTESAHECSREIESVWSQEPLDFDKLTRAFSQYVQRVGPLPADYAARRARVPALQYLATAPQQIQRANDFLAASDARQARAVLNALESPPVSTDTAYEEAVRLFLSENRTAIEKTRKDIEIVELSASAVSALERGQYESCINLCDQISSMRADVKISQPGFQGYCSELAATAANKKQFIEDSRTLDEALKNQRWAEVERLARNLLEKYPENDKSTSALFAVHREADPVLGKRTIAGIIISICLLLIVAWITQHQKESVVPASNSTTGRFATTEPNSVRLLRAAADRGDASAQHELGQMYYDGKGLAKDEVEAFKQFRKSAEHGYAAAQCVLGQLYGKGVGTQKNDIEAVYWLRKAADQGYAQAQYYLGGMYYYGRGVAKDDVEAFKWFAIAEANGIAWGAEFISLLNKSMSPVQLADAKRLAAAFVPSHPSNSK